MHIYCGRHNLDKYVPLYNLKFLDQVIKLSIKVDKDLGSILIATH